MKKSFKPKTRCFLDLNKILTLIQIIISQSTAALFDDELELQNKLLVDSCVI